MAKSLKALLEEADSLLIGESSSSVSKTAAVEDEVSALVALLSEGADTYTLQKTASDSSDSVSDSYIEGLNRAQFALELAYTIKTAEFRSRAEKEGYAEEEIEEAINKIACANLHKNLPILSRLNLHDVFTDSDL